MKVIIPPNPEERPYYAFDYVKGQLHLFWLTKDEKNKLDPHSRDAYLDLTNNTCVIRTEKGKKMFFSNRFPFGYAQWELLVLILFRAGESIYLPSENHVYALFARIYKIFGKEYRKKSDYWFIVDRNPSYCVRLNPERSYLIITNSSFDGIPHDILDIQQ